MKNLLLTALASTALLMATPKKAEAGMVLTMTTGGVAAGILGISGFALSTTLMNGDGLSDIDKLSKWVGLSGLGLMVLDVKLDSNSPLNSDAIKRSLAAKYAFINDQSVFDDLVDYGLENLKEEKVNDQKIPVMRIPSNVTEKILERVDLVGFEYEAQEMVRDLE